MHLLHALKFHVALAFSFANNFNICRIICYALTAWGSPRWAMA